MITVKVSKQQITDRRALITNHWIYDRLQFTRFRRKAALVTDGENPLGRAVAWQLALWGCYVCRLPQLYRRIFALTRLR